MNRPILNFLPVLFLGTLLFSGCGPAVESGAGETDETTVDKPNIIVIYADDLGYGDLSCYGATEIQTPNIDALAGGGVRFTNGYATSATCTPSRYGLLTGEYPWRNERARILSGEAPLLIDPEQITLPDMLRNNGYMTGVVGKWHLGLGEGNVNWNEAISPGPNEVGFDYSYIMAATNDRVPTVYVENGQVVRLDPDDPLEVSYRENFPGEPTGKDNPEMLKMRWHHGHNQSVHNGIPRIGYMRGGKSALWIDENMADTFLVRAQQFVRNHKEEPFFLYYALHQPHVPRTPHPRFVGKSGMGPRGDVILEVDWSVGELIKTLEEEGLRENTLVIFSSDNGPVLNDGYYDDAVEKLGDHTPWGNLRGGKYSLFDAGTHLPFIVNWPGTVEPIVSDALICQIDLLSSIAEMIGSPVRTPDSEALPEVLLGRSEDGRENLVLEASGNVAYRQGNWTMIPPYKGPALNKNVNIETGRSDEYQLYNLAQDPGQQENLAEKFPEKLQEMIAELDAIKNRVD